MYQAILSATDFSKGGDHAARLAVCWAEAFGASLTVHHVVPPVIGILSATPIVEELQVAMRNDAEGKLEALASELGGHVRVARSLSGGFPDVEILAEAERIDADLIVLGSTGARTFSGRLLGSTADRVLRTSPLSTLVVPLEAACAVPSRIVVGLDTSPASTRALSVATEIAEKLAAELVLVHGHESHVLERATTDAAALADAVRRAHRIDASMRIEVAPLAPAKALAAAVVRTRADLVVVGGGGRSAGSSWLLGSVADRVVRASPVPVLVVRGGEAA